MGEALNVAAIDDAVAARTHPRPFDRPGLFGRAIPFIATAYLAAISLFVIPGTTILWGYMAGAIALLVVLTVAVFAVPWTRLPDWAQPAIPFLFIVDTLLLNLGADGLGGVGLLAFLSVLWLALYGTPREVAIAVGLVALRFYAPIALDLPNGLSPLETQYRSLMLFTAVAGLVGYTVNTVVWRMRDAQHAAMSQGERFRGLLESAPDAMVVVAADGRIAMVNGQTEQLFGYDREELTGERVEMLVPARFESHETHRRRYAAHPNARPMGADLELFAKRKDGSEFPVEISLSPLETQGGSLLTAAVRDVTAVRKTERALSRANEELSRSNQELEQFAYIASHDLQEPLRSIGGFVELLRRRYEGRLDADADRFIGFTVDGVVRMQALIDSVLAYSHVGRADADRESVDTQKLVDGVFAQADSTMAELDGRLHAQGLPVVQGDPQLLRQLFTNLIGNAVKFGDGKTLRVDVSAERENGDWVFSVADNGPGIAPKDARRIFEMFKRLHGRSVPGTGIGLALCKRIAERHGGRIWVESEPGHGSAFRFAIPDPDRSARSIGRRRSEPVAEDAAARAVSGSSGP